MIYPNRKKEKEDSEVDVEVVGVVSVVDAEAASVEVVDSAEEEVVIEEVAEVVSAVDVDLVVEEVVIEEVLVVLLE